MNWDEYKSQIARIAHGKRVAGSLYVHRQGLVKLEGRLGSVLEEVATKHQVTDEFNVVKFRTDEPKISFLSYPDFYTDAHPSLKSALAVDLKSGVVRRSDYSDNLNPPILHRKEQLLPPEHPKRAEFLELTEAEEAEGLYDETKTIGFRLNWERLLAKKGLCIEGHTLKRIEADWVEPPADEGRESVDRHKTAMRRYDLSKPVKCAMETGLLNAGKTFFDYGCGLGSDMKALEALGYAVSGWDPKFRADGTKAASDVVNLGYVLNVIEDPAERLEALCSAWDLTREVLIVAALMQRTAGEEGARLFADGVLTQRNTFQKYFEQRELQQYIEDALETTAVPLALGVFAAFKDSVQQQEFVARRTRRRIDWDKLGGKLQLGAPSARAGRKLSAEFGEHRELMDVFWATLLEYGRPPTPAEFSRYGEIVEKLGSAKRALRVVLDAFGEDHYDVARESRKKELLVYAALANLRKPVPFKHLAPTLREDIGFFFDNYKDALNRGRELLMAAADPGEIEVACEGLDMGWQDEQALYVHNSLLERLPPILRIYAGCAEAYCGDLGRVDLIKIHKASGKLTFLVYDDIEHQSLPELRLRIKVNLRTGFVQIFDHSAEHQALCYKERFFGRDHPRYGEWAEFGKKLRVAGVSDSTFIGPCRVELDALLDRAERASAVQVEEL